MDTASHPKTEPRRPDPRPVSPPYGTIAGRAFAGLLALLLIGVCVMSARRGLADQIAVDAAGRVSALQQRIVSTGESADAREVTSLIDAFLLAQRFEPDNPGLSEQLGGLYAINIRTSGNQRAKALEPFASAVSMRPTSPYAWANFARIKYYQSQVDGEFYRALDNAMRLGPWEREVQFAVVDLGFAQWDTAPIALRPRILSMVQNGLRRDSEQMLTIAIKHGRLAEVCMFEKLALTAACKPAPG
jgi:hypothetical protein